MKRALVSLEKKKKKEKRKKERFNKLYRLKFDEIISKRPNYVSITATFNLIIMKIFLALLKND